MVYADAAAKHALSVLERYDFNEDIPEWNDEGTISTEERVLITQSMKEVNQIMEAYVGIVRSNTRFRPYGCPRPANRTFCFCSRDKTAIDFSYSILPFRSRRFLWNRNQIGFCGFQKIHPLQQGGGNGHQGADRGCGQRIKRYCSEKRRVWMRVFVNHIGFDGTDYKTAVNGTEVFSSMFRQIYGEES